MSDFPWELDELYDQGCYTSTLEELKYLIASEIVKLSTTHVNYIFQGKRNPTADFRDWFVL